MVKSRFLCSVGNAAHKFPGTEDSAPRVEKRSIRMRALLCLGMKLVSKEQLSDRLPLSCEKLRHHLHFCELRAHLRAATPCRVQTLSAAAALHPGKSLHSATALWHWRGARGSGVWNRPPTCLPRPV